MEVQVELVAEAVVNFVLLVELEILLLFLLLKVLLEETIQDPELLDLEKVVVAEAVLLLQGEILLTKMQDQVV